MIFISMSASTRSAMTEPPARIEPCFFEGSIPSVLADLAVEIQREADGLGRGLHPDSAEDLADLVRTMNCYYSNLIEGHNTRPADIKCARKSTSLNTSHYCASHLPS